MIELIIEPGVVKTWDQFREENGGYSIAIDGYVKGTPKFDKKGPWQNFNHHEEVDRLATRSTASQVHMAIKQGLFDTFRKNSELYAIIKQNDCDEDVILTDWFFKNPERIIGIKSEPLINRLLQACDKLDATAGAYPFDPDSDLMKEIAWIFEPYTCARISGHLSILNGSEMRTIVDASCKRISDYTMGKGEKICLDTKYETIHSGKNWEMIKEIGPYARTKLFCRGIKAYVLVRERNDGKSNFVYGKMSEYVDFPIEKIYEMTNNMEGISKEDNDRHGGNNIIGGSPRKSGSKIKPAEMAKAIDDLVAKG